MKSTKWKKYRVSKLQYPTRMIGGGGGAGGALVIGWKNALKDLEKKLGRTLPRELDKKGQPLDRPKLKSTRGEWIFMEPLTPENSKSRKERRQEKRLSETTTKGE